MLFCIALELAFVLFTRKALTDLILSLGFINFSSIKFTVLGLSIGRPKG
jgi:hypothetical protein